MNKPSYRKPLAVLCLLVLFCALRSPVEAQVTATDTLATSDSIDAAPAADILQKATLQQRMQALHKYTFINNAVEHLSNQNEGELDFHLKAAPMAPFALSNEDLQKLRQSGRDYWSEELMRRYVDIPPTLPLNGLVRSLRRQLKKMTQRTEIRNLPIPTNTEIAVLKILWENSDATASQVYAKLDTSIRLTAEDLQTVLANMVTKGFLQRQRISPLHTFDLFGVAEIPIGPKLWSKKQNRIYRYWPLVSKERLITYLESKRFLAYTGDGTFGQVQTSAKYIEEKLSLMIQ